MRHLVIAFCGLVLYLLVLPIYVRLIRQQRQAGRTDLARAYTAIVIAVAVPLVVIPWLTA